MNASSRADARASLIACAQRLAAAAAGSWSEDDRRAVRRALLDRCDGFADLEHLVTSAPPWANLSAFQQWTAALSAEKAGET